MQRFSVVQHKDKVRPCAEGATPALEDDPRWELVQRLITGPHFARSLLLSKFLLFVAAETLEGRGDEITEHQIGVQVFDRPADYRTVEDNIVRNYARQLRKRLAEHFACEGASEPWRVSIPLGGYVPVFAPAAEANSADAPGPLPLTLKIRTREEPAAAPEIQALPQAAPRRRRGIDSPLVQWLMRGTVVVLYSAAVVSITWLIAGRLAAREHAQEPAQEPAYALWAAIFGGPQDTYIVPSDAGFNLLEDLAHRPMPLAEYMQGRYQQMPLAGVDEHSADDLRSQQLTPFVDFQMVAKLARLREADPARTFIRFPRDLRLDDLKNSNAVILGSVGSNPWAAVADPNANFRIVDGPGMQGATILNTRPQPGEESSYASRWNEPAHETYALIAFLPNLSGAGHLLVLEGLDVAGTQAAAEMLFHQSAIAPVLRRATRSDGSLRSFEVLLRATSIESNATGTQVIASRIY